MTFLLEGERAWLGASQFYKALTRLNIPVEIYHLELPHIFSGEELDYYLDSLENDLRSADRTSDYYQYVKQICRKLREWTSKGYVIHVKG